MFKTKKTTDNGNKYGTVMDGKFRRLKYNILIFIKLFNLYLLCNDNLLVNKNDSEGNPVVNKFDEKILSIF